LLQVPKDAKEYGTRVFRAESRSAILQNERSYLESEYRRYIYPSEGIRALPKECIQPEYEPEIEVRIASNIAPCS
jgi:hypothetical protein